MRARPAQLLRHLSELASLPASEDAPDAVLLERFVGGHDETAFAALVARHGPMVLRLCRRVLGNSHDAEDAFQATFLVLARKAVAIRRRNHLAAWLHGTAYRLALKARAVRARLPRGETAGPALEPADPRPDPLAQMTARELFTALDEEVGRLPEVYRLPLVLCWLEGRTQEEAARQLGWTAGSVKGRLERGRARLHARLARRGLDLSAALLALEALHEPAVAGVPGALLAATARAGLLFAAGARNTGEVAAPAIALAQGVLKAMLLSKIKVFTALLLVAAVVGAGTGMFAFRSQAGEGAEGPAAKAPVPPAEAKKLEEKKPAADKDLFQGTWIAVAFEQNGRPQPPEKVKEWDMKLVVEGNSYVWRRGDSLGYNMGTFTLNPDRKPKEIHLAQIAILPPSFHLRKTGPFPVAGIYEIDDKTLKICLGFAGEPGPKDFKTTPRSKTNLFVFQRLAAGRPGKKAAVLDDAWSEPGKGLSGRLRVVWLRNGDFVRPEAIVELKNVQPPPVLLAVSNRFRLEARIHDESGKEVKEEGVITWGTALVPEQWGVVPAGAFLGYPADLRCTGSMIPPQWFQRGKAVVLVLGGTQWTLPPGRYVVSVRLSGEETKVPPPGGATRWDGTLQLPPVEVVVPNGR